MPVESLLGFLCARGGPAKPKIETGPGPRGWVDPDAFPVRSVFHADRRPFGPTDFGRGCSTTARRSFPGSGICRFGRSPDFPGAGQGKAVRSPGRFGSRPVACRGSFIGRCEKDFDFEHGGFSDDQAGDGSEWRGWRVDEGLRIGDWGLAPYDWSPYTSPDLCGIPSGDWGLGACAPAQ